MSSFYIFAYGKDCPFCKTMLALISYFDFCDSFAIMTFTHNCTLANFQLHFHSKKQTNLFALTVSSVAMYKAEFA